MKQKANISVSPKDNLKALKILTAALSLGIIFFILVVVAFIQFNGPVLEGKDYKYTNIFSIITVIITLFSTGSAFFLYTKKTSVIKHLTISLHDKLNLYKAALILFLGLCEGPALLTIIIFFLTGNFTILILTVVLLVAMLSKMPVNIKLIRLLNLDGKDQQELE